MALSAVGLIEPSRCRANFRLYSMTDIDRLRQIKRLMNDLGVNMAGVEVILSLGERINEMQRQIAEMESKVQRLERGEP